MIFFILTNFHQPSLYFMYKWQTPKYHSKSYQFLGGLSLANAAIFCWILSGVFALSWFRIVSMQLTTIFLLSCWVSLHCGLQFLAKVLCCRCQPCHAQFWHAGKHQVLYV
jgi:hypothetical protein